MRKSLNESAAILITKSLTENTDSCDLAVPRETGVERIFKRYLKEILNESAELWIMKNLSKNALGKGSTKLLIIFMDFPPAGGWGVPSIRQNN